MPLYELFCIAAHNPASPTNLKQLIEGLARQIHVNGGVVRDIKNLGVGKALPKRMKRQQQFHTRGDHFLMQFDTSPRMLKEMDTQLGRDPLVIRWTMLKKGTKLTTLLPEQPFSIEFAAPMPRPSRSYL